MFIQLGRGECERADAGRDCQNLCVARPNSQVRTGKGNLIFPVQLTTSNIGNHNAVDTFSLLHRMNLYSARMLYRSVCVREET